MLSTGSGPSVTLAIPSPNRPAGAAADAAQRRAGRRLPGRAEPAESEKRRCGAAGHRAIGAGQRRSRRAGRGRVPGAPGEIPYESARYRASADANGDEYIAGRDELFPLYLAAARDFTQPLFAYGPPRLVRLGIEVLF